VGDLLQLGNARLRIAAILVREPDTGAGFINFAPRVMMNRADLPATGLIQPASRVTYRLALAGPSQAAAAYAKWAQEQIRQTSARGMRVETVADSGPAQEQTLKRASDFLHLVALITALMAAVAVAQSAATLRVDVCSPVRCSRPWGCVRAFCSVATPPSLSGWAALRRRWGCCSAWPCRRR
jgi:Predicted ABC-type transport system involved in lysophospholipase L1 biosynthesis, permease component